MQWTENAAAQLYYGGLMSEGLFFPQQVAGGSTSAPSGQYVQDSFPDYTKPADNNTSLTSTVSNNPSGSYFGNDLSAKYSTKTLYIKDLILEEDRNKWVAGGKTYRVIFTEDFPGVYAYASSNVSIGSEINGKYVSLLGSGGFFGVSGQILKASFLIRPLAVLSGANDLTVGFRVDSGSVTNIDFQNFSNESGTIGTSSPATDRDLINDQHKFFVVDDGSAVQTNNIHDFRIQGDTDDTTLFYEGVDVFGVILYLSTDSSHLMVRPGKTFVDKTLVTTTLGSTLSIPAQNASLFHLGSKTTFFENSSGAIGSTTYAIPLLQTQATGLINTNTIAVSSNTGASFPIGSGINIQSGSSIYLGIVQSISTDTLTVSPTLPYGFAGATLTKSFFVPQPSVSDLRLYTGVTSSFYDLAYSWNPAKTYGASNWNGSTAIYKINGATVLPGFSNIPYQPYYDPQNRFAVFPITGISSAQGRMRNDTAKNFGWQGPIGVKGDFQAIEFEFSQPILSESEFIATRSTLDGVTCFVSGSFIIGYVSAIGATMPRNNRVFLAQNLGIGYHTLKFIPDSAASASMAFLTRINFYKYKGISIAGQLYSLEQNQTQYDSSSTADTPIGAYKFFGADKLTYSGAWFKENQSIAASMSPFPGFARTVSGATSNSVLTFKYWGKNFTLFTDSAGGSYTTTLDGGAITPTSGAMFTVATETIHTIVLSRASGTFGVQGIAILKDYNELKSEQSFSALSLDVHGNNILDKTIAITKASTRQIGVTAAMGGIALSEVILTSSSATTSPAVLNNAKIGIETSGNPVMIGFNSSFGSTINNSVTLPLIDVTGSATTGAYGNLYICRWPYGMTQMIYSNSDDIRPPGTIASFRYGNLIGTTVGFIFTSNQQSSIETVKAIDFAPAGRWQYVVMANVEGVSTTIKITNARLFAMETF